MKLRPEHMIRLTAAKARKVVALPALALTLGVGSLGIAPVLTGAATTATLSLAATPAAAVPVYDVANHTQNILVAIRALEQINNQIEQINNQITQIQNQADMLQNLGGNYFSGVSQLYNNTQTLLNQSEAIGANISQINAQFESLYPDDFSSASFSDMMDQIADQRSANRAAAKEAMEIGAQIRKNNEQRESRVDSIVSASLSAPGQTAVMQSQTQLLGVLSDQITELTTLIEQQGRVHQQLLAEKAAVEEMEDERKARFLNEIGTLPGSTSVTFE